MTWRLASRRDLSPQVYRRLESREQVGRGGIALDACEARVEHDWKELITEWQETARRQGLDIEPPVFGLEGEMDASREEVDDEAGADRGLFLAYLDRFENIEAEMERARDYWSAEIHANPRRADTAFRMCIEDVLRTQRLARTLCYPGSPAWEFRRNRRNLALPADTPLPLVRGVYETLLETVRDDLDLPGRTPMFWYVNNSGMATAVSDTDIEFSDEHRYEVVDNVDELLAHHAYSGERSVDPHFVRPEWAGSDRFHAWVVPV